MASSATTTNEGGPSASKEASEATAVRRGTGDTSVGEIGAVAAHTTSAAAAAADDDDEIKCGACKEYLKRSDFSPSQLLRNGEQRRPLCLACDAERQPARAPCPCSNPFCHHYPFCHHMANKEGGQPCYHGYDFGGDLGTFAANSQAMRQLQDLFWRCVAEKSRGLLGDTTPAVAAVNDYERLNPSMITNDFSAFLLSTAVDALVDCDPNLPTNWAPHLTQMGIYIGNLVAERAAGRGNATRTFEAGSREELRFKYRDVARIDGGDDVIPYLARRVKGRADDCRCLDGDKAYCGGCEKVVAASRMRRCGSCKVAQFCSRECQVNAWKKRGHKQKCPGIKKLYDYGFLA